MTKHIPETVTNRKRRMLAADVALGVIVLSAALHFFQPGVSNLLWMFGAMTTAACTVALRNTIGGADLPTADLDEYERQRHLEAREDGLRMAMATSMVIFLIAGAVAFAARFWVDPDGVDVALFFAKLVTCQLLWVPLSVARSLAGKINRDELISSE